MRIKLINTSKRKVFFMKDKKIYNLAKELWPINRSLTGEGVRETLRHIQKYLPDLTIHKVASGKKVFDWVIPNEWSVKEAWIKTPSGKKICEFKKNNLHLLGYSSRINKTITLNELSKNLYSLPNQKNAIPYVTSYYKKRWGFCISEKQRKLLKKGKYEIFIDSKISKGFLNYGELLIKGSSSKEIFLSTYICHPSMANNEISGIAVTTFLAQWIKNIKKTKYSYRIIFIPETIGSIAYLSKNFKNMKKNIIAGFNVTCVGDERAYSFLPSRNGNTISDYVGKHVLKWIDKKFIKYTWLDRGSDERQYCSPHIDLPIASLMKSKYGEYPEYHTSLDNLKKVVTPKGLNDGFNLIKIAIEVIERNCYPIIKVFGEPQLSKRGLYPTLSKANSTKKIKLMMNLMTWSDGKHSLLDIAELCNVPIWKLYPILEKLIDEKLIKLKK